ncbi:hypothetical protein D3C73_809390 [compost metagenome]
MRELLRQADLLLAEEVLEDDWQWGMINYFMNRSNHFYSLLQQSQRDEIEAQLQDFAGVPEAAGILLLERAESLIRDNCWVLYGSHLNKRAQLNQSLFGLHTGSFGFLDISRLWIKTGFAETAQGGVIGTGTGTGMSNSDSVE